MSAEADEPIAKVVTASSVGSQHRKISTVAAAAVFLVVFASHCWHQLFVFNNHQTFLWDGESYLATCNMATHILLSTLGGFFSDAAAIAKSPDFVKHILHDGPIQSFAMAFVFALRNHPPTEADWSAFVTASSLCFSASATILFYLALETTASIRLSVFAALLFGLYPSSIACSGRYGTEAWVVLALLLFVFFSTRTANIAKFVGGLCAGCVMLLKAVLVPGVVMASTLIVWLKFREIGTRKTLSGVGLAIAGALLVVAPWFLFTKQVSGTGYIFTPRMATYNMAVALDVDSDAWCTIPATDFVTDLLNQSRPNEELAADVVSKLPQLGLTTVRKIGRFVAHPWNDQRIVPFAVVTTWIQEFIHKILLVVAVLGIGLFLSRRFVARTAQESLLSSSAQVGIASESEEGSFQRKVILSSSAAIVAGHFLYLLFAAIPRFFFTMLPFVILFAAYALKIANFYIAESIRSKNSQAHHLSKTRNLSRPTLLILLATGIVWLLCASENFALPSQGFWQETLIQPGKELEVSFDYTNVGGVEKLNPGGVLLLVDADSNVENTTITFNGKLLYSRPIPINGFSDEWYLQSKTLQIHSTFLGIPRSVLRQWRTIELPSQLIDFSKRNDVKIFNSSEKPVVIYGACKNKSFFPSPTLFSSDYLLENLSRMDLRLPQRIAPDEVPSVSSRPELGISFLLLPSSVKHDAASSLSVNSNVKPTAFVSSFEPAEIHLNRSTTGDDGRQLYTMPIPELAAHNLVKLRVEGKSKLFSGDGRIGVSLILDVVGTTPTHEMKKVIPFGSPDFIQVQKNEWNEFFFEDYIPVSFLDGRIKSVTLALSPVPMSQIRYGIGGDASDVLIKDLQLKVDSLRSVDVSYDPSAPSGKIAPSAIIAPSATPAPSATTAPTK